MAEEGRLSTGWIALGALLVAAATLWPFTQALYLPLTDLPNHIARHAIMASGDGSALAQYYTSQFVLVPNSAVDILWLIAGTPGREIEFSHAVMAFAALNLFGSGLVLARVIHGRWTVWSLCTGLFVFNATFLFGFQNFVFSLPFAIYAFALYLTLEDRPVHERGLIFLVIAATLFIMHFFAFAILGALAFGRELQRFLEANDLRALGNGAVMAIPFVLPVLWLGYTMATGPENPAGSYTSFGGLGDRISRFITPLYSWAADLGADVINLRFMILTGLIYAVLATVLIPRFGLKIAPKMKGPVLMMLAVALAAPTWLSGVALIHIRFPFVFLIVMIAATDFYGLTQARAGTLALIILAFIGIRSAQVNTWWQAHDAETRDMIALFEETLEPGDRLLPVRAPGLFAAHRESHLQGYATAISGAFIPTLFQGVHAVQLRSEWQDHATPTMQANPACSVFDKAPLELFQGEKFCRTEPYLENWPQKFTKLIAMEPLDPALIEGEPITLLAQKGRFQIYRVVN